MSERRFEWGGLSADRGDYVTASEALAMLEVLCVAQADLSVSTSLHDGAAWARFTRDDRWALVSTPGSRWFSVETNTGHRLQLVDANSSKDQSAQLLAAYVDIAEAYVRGGAHPAGGRGLRGSTLTVDVDGRQVLLTQPLTRRLRGLLGR